MQVIRARALGMCFGVKDAIAVTRSVDDPSSVTIYGELVHNDDVTGQLTQRGFISQPEVGRTAPATPSVMITAHGISNVQRGQLEQAGKTIIDTTCPLVRRAHDAALRLQRDGWHVVVAGKQDHVEVIGLTGDLHQPTIIEHPHDAITLPHQRIAMICQTTLPPDRARLIFEAVERANPGSEMRFVNTICRPTSDRQDAMRDLLEQVDAVVVVGGRKSNNTRQLVNMAEQYLVPVRHVTCAAELDAAWLRNYPRIGLTAGTSTPDEIISAVEQAITDVAPSAEISPRLPDTVVPSEIWTQWFAWNAAHQPLLPWAEGKAVPHEELMRIASSLQEFQRGESSEGRSFLSRGFRHAMDSGDAEYYTALQIFIEEENRHGRYLGRFLLSAGIPLEKATKGDSMFRFLRKLGGLEIAIRVLITAEIIACTYYRAILNATSSPLLQGICRQILRDEVKHLRFQNERILILQQNRHPLFRALAGLFQITLLLGAMCVIWPRHGHAIRSGGYHFTRFVKDTLAIYRHHILRNNHVLDNSTLITHPGGALQ